jgi:hypothetical protein
MRIWRRNFRRRVLIVGKMRRRKAVALKSTCVMMQNEFFCERRRNQIFGELTLLRDAKDSLLAWKFDDFCMG